MTDASEHLDLIAFRRKKGATRRGTVEYMRCIQLEDGGFMRLSTQQVLSAEFVEANYDELNRVKFSE